MQKKPPLATMLLEPSFERTVTNQNSTVKIELKKSQSFRGYYFMPGQGVRRPEMKRDKLKCSRRA